MARRVALVFAVVLLAYAGFFALDTHLRQRRGPWEVTFTADADGTAAIVVNQPALGVRDVRLRFSERRSPLTNGPVTVRFDAPGKLPAFGATRFQDLTYLPGTVTLLLFNHEVELIPKALYLNRAAVDWSAARALELAPTNQPPPEHVQRKRRY